MLINCICSKVRSFFLVFVNLFKRALCFVNRRKVLAEDLPAEPLFSVNVVPNRSSGRQENERDWNTWDDSPRTVEEHIEKYREKLAQPPPPPPPEEQIDFFEDMTPKSFKQTKVLINTGGATQNEDSFTRLAPQSDIPVVNELKDWEELEQQAGWDEADDETTKRIIREKRKEMRSNRQKQMKPSSASTGPKGLGANPIRTTYGR